MGIFEQLSLAGIVPVIKIERAEDAVKLCEALSDGGLPVAEITFRSDAAEQAIKNVSKALPDVLLGAGTVLSVDQVKRAVDAGAAYIVSPGLNPKVVGYCVERGIPVLPGCATPGDVEVALDFGLSTVKFFPAEAAGGVKYIKAISAPYGGMKFVPTGGITLQNLAEYLAFDKVRAVGGSWMAPADAIASNDWARITSLTRAAVNAVLGMTLTHIGVNSETPERARADADELSKLMGLNTRDAGKAVFAGAQSDIFEFMKQPARGSRGHIALGVNDVARAIWHLERRGYAFDDESRAYSDGGKLRLIYLKGEFAGYAAHLVQK